MIVPYWRRLLVLPTRFLRRLIYYILNIPLQCHGMRKRNFISTSICLSVCLNSFPEEFQIRGTDETLMVETAVCPNNIFNDSFLCISTLLIPKICQTHTLLQSKRSSGFGNIPCPKWKRDWQGVRLTKHSWTISSSPSEMTKIFYPDLT